MSIVGITNVGRQALVDVVMLADVMIGMNEVGALGFYTTGKGYGVAYELVGMVGLVPSEGILHQYIHSLNQFHFFVAYRLHVGDICHVAYAITKDGQLVVHHLKGGDVEVADVKVVVGTDGVEID